MQAAADILTLFPKKSQKPNSAYKCPITSIQVCIESQKLSEFSCITSGSLNRGCPPFQPLFLKITDFCPWECTMGGGHVLITQPQATQQARGVGGGKGEGGEAGEQQIGAPGNPYFSFSSSSFSLCVRQGFDKKFYFRQRRTVSIVHINS